MVCPPGKTTCRPPSISHHFSLILNHLHTTGLHAPVIIQSAVTSLPHFTALPQRLVDLRCGAFIRPDRRSRPSWLHDVNREFHHRTQEVHHSKGNTILGVNPTNPRNPRTPPGNFTQGGWVKVHFSPIIDLNYPENDPENSDFRIGTKNAMIANRIKRLPLLLYAIDQSRRLRRPGDDSLGRTSAGRAGKPFGTVGRRRVSGAVPL